MLAKQRAERQALNRPKSNANGSNPMAILTADNEIGEALQKLDAQKSQAILNENFDICIKIKQVQGFVQTVASKYVKLDIEKKNAIANEDYETAKNLKISVFRKIKF